jgi:Acetyltransferase (GNAT) domain
VPSDAHRAVSTVRGAEKFRIVDPRADAEWNAKVLNHGGGSLFHTREWCETLCEAYGYTPVYLVSKAGDGSAILPLMEVDSRLTGRRGIGLPFSDACSPLTTAEAGWTEMFAEAVELGRERGWKSLEIRSDEGRPATMTGSIQFYEHTVDLRDGESLIGQFDGSVRRAIRKAEKSPLRVEIRTDAAAMDLFYALQCRTRRRHGLPPQPRSFFRAVHERVVKAGLAFLAVSEYEGRPVAASLFGHCGKRAIYKFGASDERFQQLRANNSVMWAGMRQAMRLGCESLSLGRTSMANEGLRRFKTNWAAREHVKSYTKYSLERNEFVQERDLAHGWHNRVFQHLPLAASRLIGAALYRHIA